MLCKIILFILAIVGAAKVPATVANGPGSVYTEIVPTRALYKTTPKDKNPPTWPSFPSATAADQVIVTQGTIPIILAEGTLYRVK